MVHCFSFLLGFGFGFRVGPQCFPLFASPHDVLSFLLLCPGDDGCGVKGTACKIGWLVVLCEMHCLLWSIHGKNGAHGDFTFYAAHKNKIIEKITQCVERNLFVFVGF